ncbi:hypothetical protein HDU98_004705 [Podochytrium sp. JEL0797]|nr:hypothetical protein HDU98_004705 [Podochytrium sp. JEL0797]
MKVENAPSFPLPQTLHFTTPIKHRNGFTETKILSHATASVPFLILTQTGLTGFRKLTLTDPPQHSSSSLFLVFTHVESKLVTSTATWTVGGTSPQNEPITCPNFSVQMSSKTARFQNPFAPAGFLYEWHLEGPVISAGNGVLLLERSFKKGAKETIAEFSFCAAGAELTSVGVAAENGGAWKTREECAFFVGTAAATLLVDKEPLMEVGGSAGNRAADGTAVVMAGLSCSVM